MLTKLKQRIQQTLTGVAKVTHEIGFTPNRLSGLGIILALLSAIAYWQASANPPMLILAAFLLLFSGFCDALDGVLARLCQQTTVFGGFLDSLLDRYADAAVMVGIIASGFANFFWGLAAIVGALLVSYARARAEAAGVKMESIGIAERAERIILLLLGSLITLFWSDALGWSVIVLAFLTNITVLQRAVYFYKASKKQMAD
ncbi:MAG: archaetidylinositol phosphate synthase [Candidatus Bathyarchaeia archaeon]|jgi:archaetidylinositol phosphate synthase|nr:CDP-alcohol phosphatidyltransferase family protein [Candidatus Bathyarchaeota archaeon A05DMB-4]MDH7594753.1 archaetidylinositol phosphate synthase [Candidatus Bathyarchaeota archaeon]